MEENVSLLCETTDANVRATFELNPTMMQAVDHLWESQHMEEWIEQTAMPAIANCPVTHAEIEVVRETVKIVTMMISVQRGFERLMAEHAASSFVDCVIRVIKEEESSLAVMCKQSFMESIEKATSEAMLEDFMDWLFGSEFDN